MANTDLNESIKIYCTSQLKRQIKNIAALENKSISSYITNLIDQHFNQSIRTDSDSYNSLNQNLDRLEVLTLSLFKGLYELYSAEDKFEGVVDLIEMKEIVWPVDSDQGQHFDVKDIRAELKEKAEEIDKNLAKYEKELDELSEYIKKKVSELPENQRVLVTAHDAFNYFAKEFGFKVEAIQGISTESEASAADIKKLSDFLVKTKIKAVFVESSVPKKTIESLVESCKAKGHNVKIGGELYSDSLGDDNTKENTYISMFKYNIDTIVDALK